MSGEVNMDQLDAVAEWNELQEWQAEPSAAKPRWLREPRPGVHREPVIDDEAVS